MRRNLAPGCISIDVKLCQRKPLFFFFFGDPFFWDPLFSFFLLFLSPAKVGSLEMQPGAKLRRISRGLYFSASRLHAAF